MASTILSNGKCSVLPTTPTHGQVFVDSEFVRWIYNSKLKLWERAGTVDSIPLATTNSDGLMSASDKRMLDKVPAVGGSFGLVVDTKLLLQSPTNPEGVIQGDIQLKSESLDIICVGPDKVKLNCSVPPELECLSPNGEPPGLLFKLNDKFLDTLIVDLPGPLGKTGDTGDVGNQGNHGFSDGPKGDDGEQGESIDELCELTDLKYNDITGIADTAIVGMELIDDDGHGCKLIVTKSKLNVAEDEPAEKIIASAISRSVVYAPDPDADTCDITRLDDFTFAQPPGDTTPLNIQLLRLPKGSNEHEDEPIGFNGTMNLQGFVGDIVTEYKSRLTKLDETWGKQVKSYVESIDDKARGILSGLADDLAQCEFDLPAVEYCITFTGCGVTPTPPPPSPPPTPPPSPSAAASARAGVGPLKIGSRKASSVQMGQRRWRVNS